MKRIALVAQREFVATVGTKGFIIGLLMMPALFFVVAIVGPRIMNSRSPPVRGDVAVIDPTGQVTPDLRTALDAGRRSPRAGMTNRGAPSRRPRQVAAQAARRTPLAQAVLGQIPALRLSSGRPVPTSSAEKDWLLAEDAAAPHLALVVMHPDAVVRASGKPDYGAYDLYVSRQPRRRDRRR